MSPFPDKSMVRDALAEHLREEADKARESATLTREGATHEESRAENDKDTRGLEASYLARGQAKRVEELEEAVIRVRTFSLADFSDRPIGLGALVHVAVDDDGDRFFFLAPAGGGETVEVQGATIHVLSAGSPVGRSLMGKWPGDDFEVKVAGRVRAYEVLETR